MWLEWKEAAPLIGVILTVFGGFIGIYLASKVRRAEAGIGLGAVPGVIGGALAERGKADALTEAVNALTAAVSAADKRNREEREENADEQARFRRSILSVLARIADAHESR